jgi:hypothetical protein
VNRLDSPGRPSWCGQPSRTPPPGYDILPAAARLVGADRAAWLHLSAPH